MTNFARSLYATTSSHVAMGVALAMLGASPAFAQDTVQAEQDAAAAAQETNAAAQEASAAAEAASARQ